jgi:hypothetical protein
MMKTPIFILSVCLLCFGLINAQQFKGAAGASTVPAPKPHYQLEYTFDVPVNVDAWSNQPAGMQVSFASADKLYFRTEVPTLEKTTDVLEKAGWRGERINAQVLVWSSDTARQVRLKVNDLVSAQGDLISKDHIKVNMVRYVVSNFPYGARNVTCDISPCKDSIYLMPDRFESFARFEVPGRTVRPVWISIDIPDSARQRNYTSTIEVQSEKTKSVLHVRLKVQGQSLPKPKDWAQRLDLWQNPIVVARHNDVKPWSEEHKLLLAKHLKLYSDAGGKYVTTYAVHSPWADNSYMIEEAMIEWKKQKNGSWKFDYSIFDTYVELAIKAGIDKAITIYTPLPWGNRFRYMDEATCNYITEVWNPHTQEYKAFWHVFLDDLKTHLKQKDWLEKTYLGINENEMKQTLASIRVIKEHSKDWRITYAGNWHAELDTLLDDYSFLYGQEPNLKQAKARSQRGATSTYYVCCNPPVPNNFVFSLPIEGRWISWYTAAYGYDGFLRWSYDAWPADPARDARHTLWPAGDCFLVYPGGGSSIRFEKLREGIVDFEKIRIVKELAATSSDKTVKKLVKELDEHLKKFVAERAFNEKKIAADVEKGNGIIEKLSDLLNVTNCPTAKSRF